MELVDDFHNNLPFSLFAAPVKIAHLPKEESQFASECRVLMSWINEQETRDQVTGFEPALSTEGDEKKTVYVPR